MRIIGPSTLLSAATTIRDEVTDLVLDIPATIDEVLGLVTRAGQLLDRADVMMSQAEDLLARGDAAVGSAETMIERGDALLARAEAALAGTEQTLAGATASIAAVQEVTQEAARTVQAAGITASGAADLMGRADALMSPLEPVATKALPLVSRFVEGVSEQEAMALARMVDRLPMLLGHLEDDVLPMLGKLDQIGPDVHEILETVHDMTRAIAGLPGASFLKRRGERKEGDDEADGAPGMPRI